MPPKLDDEGKLECARYAFENYFVKALDDFFEKNQKMGPLFDVITDEYEKSVEIQYACEGRRITIGVNLEQPWITFSLVQIQKENRQISHGGFFLEVPSKYHDIGKNNKKIISTVVEQVLHNLPVRQPKGETHE